MRRFEIALLFLGLVAFPLRAGAGVIPVTACGQVLLRALGELQADLDCTGYSGDAIVLSRGGKLSLNGFTVTANPGFGAIRCLRSCRLVGPGTIAGGSFGVVASPVAGTTGRLHVSLRSATITGASVAMDGGWAAVVSNSTITGNVGGVQGAYVTLRSSTIAGNTGYGISSAYARLIDSTVTGNGAEPRGCGPSVSCDMFTIFPPTLRGASACDHSCENGSCVPYGVCTAD